MVDNFKLSSHVLIERIKDLQQFKEQFDTLKHQQEISDLQKSYMMSNINPTERPMTANVLSKIQANSQYRKLGPSGKGASTAASTQQTTDFNSTRGFGELGSTKKGDEKKTENKVILKD